MKVFKRICSCVLIGLATSAVALPPFHGGPYVNISGGYNHVAKPIINTTTAPDSRLKYKSAYALSTELGYSFRPVRFGVEYLYSRGRLRDIYIGNTLLRSTSHSSMHAGLFNAYYDAFGLSPYLIPYVGVGLGFARFNANVGTSVSSSQVHFDNTVFAYQGILGVRYMMCRHLDLAVDYRYLRTAKMPFEVRDPLGAMMATQKHTLEQNFFNVGVTYRF